jgi:glutamine amidotransferase
MTKVCLLDYGSGNIRSIYNLIKFLGYNCQISNNDQVIKNSSHIILPGVGAYEAAMKKIKNKISIKNLENEIFIKKKFFLGICVGMQILSEKSSEFGNSQGLGWIKGDVKKIKSKILPHIGWNEIIIKKNSQIINNIDNKTDFYFVNSYHFDVEDNKLIIAKTKYGESFCSILQKDNIFGAQFHPEKSQESGKTFIKNFLMLK